MARKTTPLFLSLFLLLGLAAGCSHAPDTRLPAAAAAPVPRLLVLFFDGMRPQDLDRLSLPRFQSLKVRGLSYPNAFTGILPAAPLVVYPTAMTGRLPLRLAWQDEIYKDVAGILGKPGAFYLLSALTEKQLKKVLAPRIPAAPTPFMARLVTDRLHGKSFVFAPSPAAALALGGGEADAYRFALPGSKSDWAVDAVLDTMAKQNGWRFITAAMDGIAAAARDSGYQDENGKILAPVARSYNDADLALGRILGRLDADPALSGVTLIVTASRGGQSASPPDGIRAAGPVLGKGANFEAPIPSPYAAYMSQGGGVPVAFADSSFRLWLKSPETDNITKLITKLQSFPGVAELYRKYDTEKSYQYVRTHRSRELAGDALEWVKTRSPELLASGVSAASADVVALLEEGVGLDYRGDAGGAQEKVQRVPFFVLSSRLKAPGTSAPDSIQMVDLAPMALSLLGLPEPPGLDGRARPIEAQLQPLP